VLLALVIGGFEIAVHRTSQLAPSQSQPESPDPGKVERVVQL
jgi:hypothetical protein